MSPVQEQEQEQEPKHDLTLPDVDSVRTMYLELFQNTGDLPAHRATNSLGMYDICPKYARQNNDPYWVDDPLKTTRVSSFSFRSQSYVVEVEAAKLVEKDGSIRYYFPSTNEELVEDVLRHLMTIDRQKSFFDDNIGCQFSLFFIYSELKKYNKTRSKAEIRHSLRILQKAFLTIYLEKTYDNGRGAPLFSGPFFSEATVIDLDDYFTRATHQDEDRVKGKIKFHNMVSEGIKKMDFRLNRYDICMSYKLDMARWLHKRISHMHTGADLATPFTIKLRTIFNDGNWSWQNRNNKNKTKVETAINEMIEKGMVNPEKTTIEPMVSDDIPRYSDYKVRLYLTKAFVDHIIMSNVMQSRNKESLTETSVINLLSGASIQEVFSKLVDLGVTPEFATQFLIEYGEDNVRQSIDYTENAMQVAIGKNKPFNFVAYLKKCIENQWFNSVTKAAELLPPVDEDVVIDPNNYSGVLRLFVEEHVINLPQNAKRGFLKNGINSGYVISQWQEFKATQGDLLDAI